MSLAADFKDAKGRFLPGNSGFGGRPKGSRNKLGEAFIADLYEDWQEHGKGVLEQTRLTKPEVYMRVVASLLPKDVNLNVGIGDQLSDDDLAIGLAAVRAAIAARGPTAPGDGAKVIDGVVQAEPIPTGRASSANHPGA
jgi:hypothetical protein